MNIVLTGSLGHIGEPLTRTLVEQGHHVTVISSSAKKQEQITALGAAAAIGSIDNVDFLTSVFQGADAVYCMVPPANMVEPDRRSYYSRIARNYVKAINHAGVKRVLHLSSFGAHLDHGTGIILGAYDAEQLLNEIPGIRLTHIRPTYFNYNLLLFIDMIRHRGVMAANYGEEKIILVSPLDIAAAIADEIQLPSTPALKIRYVASEELTGQEIATALGTAIGKPDLKWVLAEDEVVLEGMKAHGIPELLANGYVEMYRSVRTGAMSEDFYRNKPVLGKVRLEQFIPEFVAAYNSK